MSEPKDRDSAPAEPTSAQGTRLRRLARRASMAIVWERVWPRLVAVGAVMGTFIAVSWVGIWLDMPAWGRIAGSIVFALALFATVTRLFLVVRPTRGETLGRLDRDCGIPHRPASALSDALANSAADPATRALWQLHRRRLEADVGKLEVSAPSPRMVERDRFAGRAAVLAALIAAGFIAGPEKFARIAAAFDWRSQASAAAKGYRLDAWIDPPAYTARPPVILPIHLADEQGPAEHGATKVQVPVGSIVVVRSSVGLDVATVVQGNLVAPPPPKDTKAKAAAGDKSAATPASEASGTPTVEPERELRWTLKGDARLLFQRDDHTIAAYDIVAIADQPPTITVAETPVGNARGSLTIGYETKDDYGVSSAEASFARPVLRGRPITGRSLVEPPKAGLTLPPGANGIGKGQTTVDLSAHPWAGAKVLMTLTARDEGGNVGESAPVEVNLPQRPFLKPLARALVEQRRNLVLAPDDRARVVAAMDALLIAPEQFTPEASIYLGLHSIQTRLAAAKTDDDLRGTADLMWEMALRIEDGDLSDAERELRAAEQQLREAMQRGASDAEIKKLTENMRAALDKFLNEMARRQPDSKNADKSGKPSRTITPEDLKRMMDRMADAAKNGNMADAQQMLDQLQSVLENLKTARGKGDGDDPTAREMTKSLNELDKMTREQQELRDKTFREGQRRRNADPNKRGSQDQSGEEGQDGQQGQQDDQADNGESGQDKAGQDKSGKDKGGAQPQDKDLQKRQDALRKQLGELKKRMKDAGVEGEKGLDDAEEAMGDAGKALGKGRDGSAVDAQGRALEGLRRGAQGMAQKLENGNGQGQAEGEREGSGSTNGRERGRGRDPLDRPRQNSRDAFRGGTLNGGPGAAQRAQQVLEELRRRLGDPQRPREELDYLGRLLQRY